MPTLMQVLQEAARRGLPIPADKKAIFDEAVHRGLIHNPDQSQIAMNPGHAPLAKGGAFQPPNFVAPEGSQDTSFRMDHAAGEAGSGLAEGAAAFLDMGAKINPIRAAMDYGERKLGDWGVLDPEKVKKMQELRTAPASKLIQPVMKTPDPYYGGVRKGAQFVGAQAIPDIATGGLAAVPTSVASGLLAAGGDTLGRDIAEENFPGNSWTGEAPPSEDPNERTWYDYARSWTPGPADVAGFIGAAGGGAAPTLLKTGAEAAIHSKFKDVPPEAIDPKTGRALPTDPDYIPGKDAWDASKRQGIPATGGSLGNKKLASWEQNTAMQPFGGSRTRGKMNDMNAAMDRRLTAISQDARAVVDPRSGQVILPGAAKDLEGMPKRILTAAKEDAEGAAKNVTFPMDKMEKTHGPSTAVDVPNTLNEFDNQLARPSPRDRLAIQEQRDQFQQAKTSVLDAGQEKILQADLTQKQYWLDHVNNEIANGTKQYGKRDLVKAQKELEASQAAIEKNRGVPYDWLKREKTGVYDATSPNQPNGKASVPSATNKSIGAAMKEDQLLALEKSGVPRAEAESIFGNYGKDMFEDPLDKTTGTVPRLNEVAAGEGREGYKWLTEDKMQYPERFQLMQQGAEKHAQWLESQGKPQEAAMIRQRFRQTIGDVLETTGRAKDGQVEVGSQFSGDTFTTNMNSASKSPETMAILSNGDRGLEQDIADMVTIGKGARSRGREINASRTQTHSQMSKVFNSIGSNGLIKTIADVVKGATGVKAADMLLSSDWLPEAVVNGVSKDWKKNLGKRAGFAAGASAANSSMADQFGGPR